MVFLWLINKILLLYILGHRGYDYIVPLVTNENEDGSIQRGVLFNKGWIPKEFARKKKYLYILV